MTRCGGTALLVAGIALAMAGGSWLGLRPFLGRETVRLVIPLAQDSAPSERSEIVRGVELALEESGHRAGYFRVEHESSTGYEVLASNTSSFPSAPSGLGIVALPHLWFPHLQRPVPDGPGRFLIPLGDASEGDLGAAWAASLGAKSVFVLGTDSRRFFEASRELGISSAGFEPVPEDPAATKALIRRVARWRTDLVYVDAPDSGGRIVRDLRAQGYRGRILLTGRSVEPAFLATVGTSVRGVYFTTGVVTAPPADFARRYAGRHGAPPGPYAYAAYLSCRTVVDALDRAGTRTKADLERVLKDLDGPVPGVSAFEPAVGFYRVRDGRFEPAAPPGGACCIR